MRFYALLLLSILFFAGTAFTQEIQYQHDEAYRFIENKGQWNKNVLFKASVPGGNLWIQQKKFVYHFQDLSPITSNHASTSIPSKIEIKQNVVHLNFVGSALVESCKKGSPSNFYYNYFIGKNVRISHVKAYNEAQLHEIYAGIDLKLINDRKKMKYEFIVHPNSDPNTIKYAYSGHQQIKISKKGQLIVAHSLGEIIEEKPYSYQIINGKIIEVESSYQIVQSEVKFKIGTYNKNYDLIIDPTLIFSTFSGSITDNFGMSATYAHDGSAISGGTIYGNAYPTPDPNAFDINSNFTVPNVLNSASTDVFVSKFSPNGSQMLWTTFLGGGDNTQGTETVHSMICDAQDNIYLFGVTSSLDFPTTNAYQNSHAGGTNINISSNGLFFGSAGTDFYISKLSTNGHQLLASTYLGGSQNDGINYHLSAGNYPINAYDSLTVNYGDQFRGEIQLDQSGNVLVASCTRSNNFPTVNPIQLNNQGQQDGVVFVFNNNLSTLLFSSYLGGSNNDALYSIKVNSNQQLVVAGGTSSNNLSTTAGAWQTTYQGGVADGFIALISANYTTLNALTFVGTSNYDQVFFVELDRQNNIYAMGQARGGLFPVMAANYVNPNSAQFVAKFSPNLSTSLRSTVFGNGNPNMLLSPSAFLIDNCENIYISGWGANLLQSQPMVNMPISPNAFQSTVPNGFDFYLMVLERDMNSLLYGSYMGGNLSNDHVDGGTSRFDKNGIVYQAVCAGCHGNSDFPTTPNAWSNVNLAVNGCNTVVFKYDFQLNLQASFSSSALSACAPETITFTNSSQQGNSFYWNFGNGSIDSTTFQPSVTYTTPGTYNVSLIVTDSICQKSDTSIITITIFDQLQVDLGLDTLFYCTPTSVTLNPTTIGTILEYRYSLSTNFTSPLNTDLQNPQFTFTPTQSAWYYCQASNNNCTSIDSIYILILSEDMQIQGETEVCKGDLIQLFVQNSSQFNFSYLWTPQALILSGQGTPNVQVDNQNSSTIYLEAISDNGCVLRDTVSITIKDELIGNIVATSNPYYIMKGASSLLQATPNIFNSYSWTPSVNLSTSNQISTTATPLQTTIYTVTGTYQGCKRTDTTIVHIVDYVCDVPYVYVPNAFSPNGDGDNDLVYVRGVVISSFVFRIYNRWGQLVFETNDQFVGWDGKYKGVALDPDVYDYYLDVICLDEQKQLIKGNITLLK